MELNQYAIWKCKVKMMQRAYQQNGHDMDFAGNVQVELDLKIVAPTQTLGRALLDIHFDETTRGRTELASGRRWEFLEEPTEEKLHGIIRYEDAYRGRM